MFLGGERVLGTHVREHRGFVGERPLALLARESREIFTFEAKLLFAFGSVGLTLPEEASPRATERLL